MKKPLPILVRFIIIFFIVLAGFLIVGYTINALQYSDVLTTTTPIDTTGAAAYLIQKEALRLRTAEERRIDSIAQIKKEKDWQKQNPKAYKILKKHPEWTKEDCEKLTNGSIWIGMSFEMLKYVYGGNPDSANPSNFGKGTRWQWCWHDYKPSCFYDNDGDGLIDSYN